MFDRIEINLEVMLGKPVIKGTRLPVCVVVESVAAGNSYQEILKVFPFITEDDIKQALLFAAKVTEVGLEVAY